MRIILIVSLILFVSSCKEKEPTSIPTEKANAYALDGTPLFSTAASLQLMQQYAEKKAAHINNPTDIDALIWHGRYAAYAGDYDEAINLYTQGMNKFPQEPRLYRHRGHRYITTRQYDKAIIDLSYAAQLVQGTPNKIEPDGMPNAKNIPVSTLHGNIFYHLGLAQYLNGDLDAALQSYLACLESSDMVDNLVSSTHWIYMILRRLGRHAEANKVLIPINIDFDIIENHSYHKLCLYYKGELTEDEVLEGGLDASANDAVLYGLANWYNYNNQQGVATSRLNAIINNSKWNSFGYIAAEADLYNTSH